MTSSSIMWLIIQSPTNVLRQSFPCCCIEQCLFNAFLNAVRSTGGYAWRQYYKYVFGYDHSINYNFSLVCIAHTDKTGIIY